MTGRVTNAGFLRARGFSQLTGGLTTKAGSTLQLQGDGTFGTATLDVTGPVDNLGLLELTSINGGFTAQLRGASGAVAVLVNHGEIRSSVGAGGPRTLVASVDNEGLIQIDQGLQINQGERDHRPHQRVGRSQRRADDHERDDGAEAVDAERSGDAGHQLGDGAADGGLRDPGGDEPAGVSGSSTVQGPGSS